MTLTRSPIARTGILKPARLRKCAVKGCANRFQPRNMGHKVCGPACAEVHAAAERKRLDAKQTRERKQKLKTRGDYLKEAQAAFNAFIRARDAALPCICCGQFAQVDVLTGGAWDAGHYRSVGSAPHLRFNEDNCHRQRKRCNRDGAGRAVDYRVGLIGRIGLARVEALEADQEPEKWTAEELVAIRETYRAKLKALKAAA